MKIKTLSAVIIVTAAFAVPAFAQHHHVRGPSYHRQAYGYGPAYSTRTFRSAYARLPAGEPLSGDWYDPFSRVGGADPDMNPSGN